MVPGLLSVVLANYNEAGVIADQIRAVLGQSYGNFEFIILDDASTDNSVAVIEAATGGDPRVVLVKNETNLGVVGNYEKGRRLSRGEFLCTLAAGDRVLPGFFETCISALQQVPRAGLCCGDPAQFRIRDQTLELDSNPFHWSKEPVYLDAETLAELICGRFLVSYAAVFRQDAYQTSLPPPHQWARLRWSSDWFLIHVLAFRHGIVHIPSVLSAVRFEGKGFHKQGIQDWGQQKDVLLAVFELLRSEMYRDVLPYFARGALLAHLPGVVRLAMSRPDLWDPATLMLIQRPLLAWNLHMNQVLEQRARGNPPGA
jgi:glycosyltransferase involved in cell wall biosynthesis